MSLFTAPAHNFESTISKTNPQLTSLGPKKSRTTLTAESCLWNEEFERHSISGHGCGQKAMPTPLPSISGCQPRGAAVLDLWSSPSPPRAGPTTCFVPYQKVPLAKYGNLEGLMECIHSSCRVGKDADIAAHLTLLGRHMGRPPSTHTINVDLFG